MSRPKILIVGCGSVGLAQGYHLSTGADITYLVRPGRKPAFVPPKRLYDYKSNALRVFDSYRLVESTDEVAGEKFYCIFDTLDGHTARSEGGTATLRAVGDLIRDAPETFVAYDAVGVDIDHHYATSLGISKTRLLLVGSMLVHNPTASISIPASADRDLVVRADMLYSSLPGDVGLVVINSNKKTAKALEEVYSQNGRLHIQFMPAFVMDWATNLVMLHLVTWNIDGFKEFQYLQRNKGLWSTMLRAQTEILRLPRFGWMGWLLSFVFGSWATAKINLTVVKGALPLVLHEFNAFHHGGKVVRQDIQVLEDLVADGEKAGHKMEALRDLCRKAHNTEKEKGKARASGINMATAGIVGRTSVAQRVDNANI